MSKSLTVNDLMDKQFLTFSEDTTLFEAVEILQTRKLFGGCIVDKAGRVLGILSERACIGLYEDIVSGKSDRSLSDLKVTDGMYPEVSVVPASLGIVQAAELFLKNEYRRLPVVESGRLVGQITRRDIIKAVRQMG